MTSLVSKQLSEKPEQSTQAAPCSQDVGDDPDGPAVHSFAVGLLCQNFRS